MTTRRDKRGKPKDRRPTEDELTLFESAMRDTARRRPAAPRAEVKPAAAKKPPPKPTTSRRTPVAPKPAAPNGVDKRTAQRLQRGQMPIEARLDLHGRQQTAAHRELTAFINASHAVGRRCVLIITGKGAPRAEDADEIMPDRQRGVLKRQVPLWLSEAGLHEKVLSVQPARRQHGGDGALYVLLRRRRESKPK